MRDAPFFVVLTWFLSFFIWCYKDSENGQKSKFFSNHGIQVAFISNSKKNKDESFISKRPARMFSPFNISSIFSNLLSLVVTRMSDGRITVTRSSIWVQTAIRSRSLCTRFYTPSAFCTSKVEKIVINMWLSTTPTSIRKFKVSLKPTLINALILLRKSLAFFIEKNSNSDR